MFSSRAEPRSIESKLVLLFITAAAVLLCSALGVFYWMVLEHADEEDNTVLADKADGLQNDVEQQGGNNALLNEINVVSGPERASFLVRLLDSAGATIRETPRMGEVLPSNMFPSPTLDVTAAPVKKRNSGRLFALTARNASSGGQSFTIQVAQDRSVDEELANELRILILVTMVIGSAAAAGFAITVTRRGLRPLSDLAGAVQRIGPKHFNERVVPSRWPRELQPLAHAFDQMLDRLEDSFTRLSRFSADLAHELRTPIANIMGEAQVALTRQRTLDEYREVVESTVTECEHLSGIVDNLLFLARAESTDKQIQPAQFDGRAAIEKIAGYYQAIAEDRQITILCEGHGEIFADPMLFDRALGNLVENALRFTKQGGEIRIAFQENDHSAVVTVADTGIGIAPEHLPRVFDRFYRADPSRSTDGTGLGLALVKTIADLHGGNVTINSELERGTTVTLVFPRKKGSLLTPSPMAL